MESAMRLRKHAFYTAFAVACLSMLAFVFFASRAVAQDTVPHAEACTHNAWGYLLFSKLHFGTTNMCSKPISIWFVLKSGKILHRDVAPRGVFDTGLVRGQFNDHVWVAATCPLGYRPRPVVSLANWDTILKSRYVCARTK
jgi:hypothetical protein